MLRRKLIFILFPGVLFLWIIGWGLYWIGDNQRERARARTGKQNPKEQPIEIQVGLNLQEHEIPQ